MLSLVNANSPLVWDAAMIGAARVYAEAGQGVLVTPFILAGAMAPVTIAAAATQTLAEALAGMAYVQLVRPGNPVVFGSFASSLSMQSGAPTFGTPEPTLLLYLMAQLARRPAAGPAEPAAEGWAPPAMTEKGSASTELTDSDIFMGSLDSRKGTVSVLYTQGVDCGTTCGFNAK